MSRSDMRTFENTIRVVALPHPMRCVVRNRETGTVLEGVATAVAVECYGTRGGEYEGHSYIYRFEDYAVTFYHVIIDGVQEEPWHRCDRVDFTPAMPPGGLP